MRSSKSLGRSQIHSIAVAGLSRSAAFVVQTVSATAWTGEQFVRHLSPKRVQIALLNLMYKESSKVKESSQKDLDHCIL